MAQEFLRAVESQGMPVTDDLQDSQTGHGAEQWAKWIDRDTGRRSDSAHAYTHSTMRNQGNLLLCNTKIDKIVFEGNKAVGVERVPTRPMDPTQTPQKTTYFARKQVVVSCGSLSSPSVLQRSGIGSGDRLRVVGVKPLIELPGVGLNYQDHYSIFAAYRAKPNTNTFDDFVRGDPKVQKMAIDEFNSTGGNGPLASNGIDAGVKIRPTEKELQEMGPEFRLGWDSYFKVGIHPTVDYDTADLVG